MPASLALPILTTLSLVAAVPQQDAQSILRTVAEKQAERWAGIENYTIEESVEGAPFPVPVHFEKTTAGGRTTFRRVPTNEWAKEAAGAQAMQPEHYELLADGYEMVGDAHVQEGHPLGLEIRSMMYDGATFLRAGADAERSGAAYADGDADAAGVRGMAEFARRARLAGRESVDGRDAFLLRADDLTGVALEQPEGGEGEFTLRAISLWIDTQHYVPVRMAIEGRLAADGRTTPLTMELLLRDYREVQGLFEAETHVMRMSGMMEAMATDPEKRKELEEARREVARMQAEMEKMEAELAKMPAAARGMVENQMKKSMERLDMMLSDGVIETVMRARVIAVNEGPPLGWRPPGGV